MNPERIGDNMQTLFEKITAVTMDPKRPVIENAYVLIDGEKIAGIFETAPPDFGGRRVDGKNKVLMPGLTNIHTHMPMTVFRGYADDYTLSTWLNDYIFPAEDKLTSEAVRTGTDLALAEMIATGTSSVSDMYYFCEDIAQSAAAAGVKANISRSITVFDDKFNFNTYPAVEEMKELVARWHGHDNNRIKIDASIHGEYTSNPALWRALGEYAHENMLGMQVHVSETSDEHNRCKETYGATPACVLAENGAFDVPVTAAHCVWVEPDDIALFKEKGVSVAYNPVSNMKLASGYAPVYEMAEAGVNVGLGTDGVASNNSHDLFEEIKFAALVQKLRYLNPEAGTSLEALKMATVNGAIAQQRPECGMIKVGMDADLIMVDFDRPHLTPCYNVLSNLVYSARGSDVVMNMVRGRILYSDGIFHTIDIEKVKYEVRRSMDLFR